MSPISHARGKDPIRPWYEAIEALGDYTSFRLGHVHAVTGEVRWHDVPHKYYDGIGGFADILREGGNEVPPLPENKHPSAPSWWPFFRSIPALLGPRRRLQWKDLERGPEVPPGKLPLPALAWHVFDESQSSAVRSAARRFGVTINSYLLKRLDDTLRGDLRQPDRPIPWMIPVNLRGKISRERETENHSSYLAIKIAPSESVQDLHREIYRRLDRGEHWAAWKGYSATRLLPQALKRLALKTDRAMTQWNLGLFTNLGNWDPEKTITHDEYRGAWVLLATVLRCQLVGAACMTFQGRLSLSLQVHPDLTTSPEVPKRWLKAWMERIAPDLEASPTEVRRPATGDRRAE